MRTKTSFNNGWRFKLGDETLSPPRLKEIVYNEAKTESVLRGCASKNYGKNREMDYERWDYVTLPHDFIIPQEPKEEYNSTLGYFKYENGWYRKTFKVSEEDKDKRISLYFEGIATYARVYLNGTLLARSFSGFASFEVDLTDYLRFDEENVLAVYVNTTERHEGWWYSGGGIYRPVWMIKTERVSVDIWGTYIHPEKKEKAWDIPVDVTLRNDDTSARTLTVYADILYGEEIVASTPKGTLTVDAKAKNAVHLRSALAAPHLWDCEHPHLYTATVHVFDGEEEIDTVRETFGFRTLDFDPDHGFFLNGEHTIIKGVCCHEDYGLEGKAVSDSVKLLRLEKLREMGANGYRTAHYPHSEKTFQYLAELGFLVFAETRRFDTSEEGLQQLEMMIKCHRNNPAIILWSLGNEEPLHNSEVGKRIFASMRAHALQFDATRPYTTAVSHEPRNAPVMDEVDVIGVNYNLPDLDILHEKYPDKIILASECCAVGSTRGWTLDDCEKRGYLHGYDNRDGWFSAREKTWKHFMARPWFAGGYQWAGIEHRGETQWPRLCSQSGALDMFLLKKDAFYINKAYWSDEPLVHIYPHWNLDGREGEVIPVWVYTNCDTVALYQDGTLLDTVSVEKYGHAEFSVTYAKGELTARGYRDGQEVATDTVRTTKAAVALKLELQNTRPTRVWDALVFNCYAVDENGDTVPTATPYLHFDTNSFGAIVGTGSDVSDHIPVPTPDRRMHAGIATVCVRAKKSGTLRVYVTADGLTPASASVEII